MKKIIVGIFLSITSMYAVAQVNETFVRHDTTLLKASECEWVVQSLNKGYASANHILGRSVSGIILSAIKAGKLKAIDQQTNKPIPATAIYTWNKGVDTIPQYDADGNFAKYVAIQQERSSDNITQIRVFSDWYFNVATGKFRSTIKWIELLEEVHASSGFFIGYQVLCRIFYQ